jgi:hypothetical protein
MGNDFIIESIRVNIKGNIYEKPVENSLEYFLEQFKEVEYKEITLEGNNNSSLLIEMNKNKSLCIFWEDIEKDVTYHSLNKNGKKEFYEEFIIPNGQKDIYEDIYLIENDKIYEIIEHYYNHGTRSKIILWEQD